LKGLSVATKRIKSGTQKLQIDFSEKHGGPIGQNARAFIDEVVTFTRKRAPIIGVRSWKDIKKNVKDSIATDILVRSIICVANHIKLLITKSVIIISLCLKCYRKGGFYKTQRMQRKRYETLRLSDTEGGDQLSVRRSRPITVMMRE